MMEIDTERLVAGHPAAAWRLLAIEDAPAFQIVLETLLGERGFQTRVAGDGSTGLDAVLEWHPDLVLLDLGLPDIDGFELCGKIRAASDAFVIMVTGRTDDASRFDGLETGADSYITKPFDSRELLLAIEVLLRRSTPQGGLPDVVVLGGLTLDRPAGRVLLDGEPVHLTNIELSLLERLARSDGDVVTRSDLVTCLWGPNWAGDDHAISVHMANLRKKIDPEGTGRIETVRGVGYRLNA